MQHAVVAFPKCYVFLSVIELFLISMFFQVGQERIALLGLIRVKLAVTVYTALTVCDCSWK